MASKAYRATDVKNVELRLSPERQGVALNVGIDVAKDNHLVVLRWSDRGFERPWKVANPQQLPCLLALLQTLRTGRDLCIAVEPTGTYADSLRQLLHEHDFVVHRVSPKAAHDYAEVFDGVPSQHDGKDAAVLAELAALGKSVLWPFALDAKEREMAVALQRLILARADLVRCYGRLEGLLARHWPEAIQHGKLTSGILLRCLAHYGGPKGVKEDPQSLAQLRRWDGRLKQLAKAEALVQTAPTTLGVRQLPADETWMRENAAEALRYRAQMRVCERHLRRLAASNETLQRQGKVVGVPTACVLGVELGDPHGYGCAQAYRKAMGLNLAEYSSGRYKGELHVSKRGSSEVRRWLYFAALRLIRQHPQARQWYAQKQQKDQSGKGAVVAVMRRLALALYHVGKGRPFEVERLFAAAGGCSA
jgi:transposase